VFSHFCVFSRNQSLLQVSTNFCKFAIITTFVAVSILGSGGLETVRCSVSDVASANRFCVRTIQIVGVRWP